MKNLSLLFAAIIAAGALFFLNFQIPAHQDPVADQFSKSPFEAKNNLGWFKVKDQFSVSNTELTKNHKATLGFSKYDQLELKKSDTDKLGITHYRFDQYHRGVRIEGAELLVHEKNDKVQSFNGKWFHHLDLLASPSLSAQQAIQKGLQYFPAETYFWEDQQLENHAKTDQEKANGTYYPQPELVWIDPTFSQNKEQLKLAYQFNILAIKPLRGKTLFVDALNGDIIYEENLAKEVNSIGTTFTKFSGNQTIITDSLGPNNFRLIEANRPSPIGPSVNINTLNVQGTDDISAAVHFTDTDNHWVNFNANRDEVATDVHWCVEKTFDYMTQMLDWNGINNGSLPYRSYVHFDDTDDQSGLFNAMWLGAANIAVFGDGDDPAEIAPLTAMDIVAHEYTHGVIDYTANLRYQRESGALNESFCDIIGSAVEAWAKGNDASWLLGNEIYLNGGFLRSMADPKAASDPDTYDGMFWQNPDCGSPTEDNDRCGVHTNSGVQNRWYYILTEGDTGVNDHGDAFDVAGIGFDAATKIAFRSLRFYLGEDSKFIDAMEGSLQAAEDLYGKCSPEYVSTANAWFAVGVGNGLFESDMEVSAITGYEAENCGLMADEFPTIDFVYQSCVPALPAGSKIPFAAQVDNGPVVLDTLTLAAEVIGFEPTQFTFTKPVNGLETGGIHELKIWTNFPSDVRAFNDTATFVLENIIDQNTDFGANFANEMESGCFLSTQNISANFVFLGCEIIAAGEELDVYYRVNGGTPVKETTTLVNPIFRNGTFTYNFTTPLDLSTTLGSSKVDFWIDLDGDFLNENDTLFGQIVRNPYLLTQEQKVTFEAGETSLDSIYFQSGDYSAVAPGTSSKFDQPNIIVHTGGDFQNSGALVPNPNNVWSTNNRPLSSQSCFCVDATALTQIDLDFDLQQSYCRMWQSLYGQENPYGSAVRVLVDGTQIGETLIPETLASDDAVNRVFNLDAYGGSTFEVCIEARCGFSPEFDQFNKGDLARIDNVRISGTNVGTRDLQQIKGLTIFPNPSDGRLTVAFTGEATPFQLEVFDIFGRKVKSENNFALNNKSLDLSHLEAGTYFIRLSNGQQLHIEQVVLF